MPVTNLTEWDRFRGKVVYSSTGCWLWRGWFTSGRPRFDLDTPLRGVRGRKVSAHRWVYDRMIARLEGRRQKIEMVCGDMGCVNPYHMRVVTGHTKRQRAAAGPLKEFCGRGHRIDREKGYCVQCHLERNPRTGLEYLDDWARFMSHVEVERDSGCWLWGGHLNSHGYAQFGHLVDGVKRRPGAHRYAYERLRGEIPGGKAMDHLCRNRHCVNPYHVEPVDGETNVRRGLSGWRGDCAEFTGDREWNVYKPRTIEVGGKRRHASTKIYCKHGHMIAGANVHVGKDGRRKCRECQGIRSVVVDGVKCHPQQKIYCKYGHMVAGDNLLVKDGRRRCRTCYA